MLDLGVDRKPIASERRLHKGLALILVVDDEPPIRQLLQTGLSTEGYQVEESCYGRATITVARNDAFDLILLDLGLPDVNGMEVLQTLQGKGMSNRS